MDEEQLELWDFCKQLNEKVPSTYYYAIEKYRNICEEIADQIWEEEFLKLKNKYKNLVKFTEDYLGIKLMWYQKILLEMIYYQ